MMWLDEYERKARLIPGLWMMGPVVILGLMFGLRETPVVSAIVGLLATAGGPVVLAGFVRHRGLEIQGSLVTSWGGWPTTQLLRSGSPTILAKRRADTEKATKIALPPPESDGDAYDAAVGELVRLTRSKTEFPLVFEENKSYGFERNMLGVQPLAKWISASCVAIGGVAGALVAQHRHSVGVDLWTGFLLLVGICVFWFTYPSSARARVVAFKYAERVVEAASQLAA